MGQMNNFELGIKVKRQEMILKNAFKGLFFIFASNLNIKTKSYEKYIY